MNRERIARELVALAKELTAQPFSEEEISRLRELGQKAAVEIGNAIALMEKRDYREAYRKLDLADDFLQEMLGDNDKHWSIRNVRAWKKQIHDLERELRRKETSILREMAMARNELR